MSQYTLQNSLQTYLYQTITGPQFLHYLTENKTQIKTYLQKNNLYELRYHDNQEQKDTLKINVDRYVHAFKLGKQMESVDLVFRKADFVFSIIGMSLNTRAFLGTIQMIGDEGQVGKWRREVLNGRVFGSYGQTQLGHGSDVQALQTEAHFDQRRRVFIINSPKITSAKYWPGTLGMVCTHTVLQAKTYVKGQYIGLQTFVIQIRDENLKPLPGIKCGDIGPKFGYHRVDNGYLSLDNVIVPLDSMLMKYVQITPQGIVKGKQNKAAIKYAYGSMLQLRVTLPFNISFGHIIHPAINLFKLYEQMGVSHIEENRNEILNYLCIGQGMIIANTYSQRLFHCFNAHMKDKDYKRADQALSKCHIISSTFKAMISWKAVQICTKIATRNTFCTFRTTGIPYAYNYVISAPTYEGDNNVLLQQTARYILKQNQQVQAQLIRPDNKIKLSNLSSVLKVLQYVTQCEIVRLKNQIKRQEKLGIGKNTTWNERLQRDIIEMAKIWGNTCLLKGFIDSLSFVKQDLQKLVNKLGCLFAKNILMDVPQVFTYGFQVQESGYEKQFTTQQFKAMTHLERPLFAVQENHTLIPRQGTWLYSKL